MTNKKEPASLVRSSAAEYLTFAASAGDNSDSMEMRYEDENIWLTQKNDGRIIRCVYLCDQSAYQTDLYRWRAYAGNNY